MLVASIRAAILIVPAALAFAGCGPGAEDAARAFLKNKAGVSSIERTSTQTRFGREYVRAFTDEDHEVVVEVAKEGSKWVAENCVDPDTYTPRDCFGP